MREVGKTWKLDQLYMAVVGDSEDYTKVRMGKLGVLDTLYTVPHYMGTEALYRDLEVYILSGYDPILLGLIQTGGYYTLTSDQGDEGDYYIVSCAPTHKQALNKDTAVYHARLELRKENPE